MSKKRKQPTAREIRKELAILINAKKDEGIKENIAVNTARQEINTKYGKNWRENFDNSFKGGYDAWWSEKNLDGSFAYNGVTDDF